MSEMIEQLLDLSRIGQKEYPREELELDALLTQCAEEQERFLQERDLVLKKSVMSHAKITGSSELIRTLFTYLLSNAVKYASGPDIELELSGNVGGGYHFSISNEFQNEDLDMEQIWEPFYVGEPSRNKSLSGTGLGLSIVREIVGQCGYQVRCWQKDGKLTVEVEFQ